MESKLTSMELYHYIEKSNSSYRWKEGEGYGIWGIGPLFLILVAHTSTHSHAYTHTQTILHTHSFPGYIANVFRVKREANFRERWLRLKWNDKYKQSNEE